MATRNMQLFRYEILVPSEVMPVVTNCKITFYLFRNYETQQDATVRRQKYDCSAGAVVLVHTARLQHKLNRATLCGK
jgi:hypothetical protein